MAVNSSDIFGVAGGELVCPKKVGRQTPTSSCFLVTPNKNVSTQFAILATRDDHATAFFMVAVGET